MSNVTVQTAVPPTPAEGAYPTKVFLVSYPKIVFLYPTFLWSIFAAIYLSFLSPEEQLNPGNGHPVTISAVFMWLLAVNLVVLSFDFPRGTSLTLFFFALVLVLGGWLLITFYPHLLPQARSLIRSIRPLANPTFYYVVSAIMGVIYLIVFVVAQFDYWEVRSNELLHHHGFLSDMERFPAPQLKVDKETNDVFEYILLRSGRLILHPSNERRAFVLDNVPFINKKEVAITRMLGAMQVHIRPEEAPE